MTSTPETLGMSRCEWDAMIGLQTEIGKMGLRHIASQHEQEIRDVSAWREHVEMEIKILCILLDVAKFKKKE